MTSARCLAASARLNADKQEAQQNKSQHRFHFHSKVGVSLVGLQAFGLFTADWERWEGPACAAVFGEPSRLFKKRGPDCGEAFPIVLVSEGKQEEKRNEVK